LSAGLGVMAVSLWLLFDQQLYLQNMGADQTDYYIGTYIILGIGAVMTLVGFLGCCGAWKESTWMLGTFFLFLVIIFLAEIAFGVLIYFQEAPYPNVIRDSVEATVTKKYHNNSTATTQTFDLIQEGLRCCGAEGPEDWARSVFNGFRDLDHAPEIGIPRTQADVVGGMALTAALPKFNIPTSCCKIARPETVQCQAAVRDVRLMSIPKEKIYDKGCSDALIDFAEEHFIYLVAVAGGVALIQLIGMILSCCLCCTLRKIDDFKA